MNERYNPSPTQAQSAGAIPSALMGTKPEEVTPDLALHMKAVDSAIHRLSMVDNQLAAQIGRLYGEGDPPASEDHPRPQPVGMHHEMANLLRILGETVTRVESRAMRLSAYA